MGIGNGNCTQAAAFYGMEAVGLYRLAAAQGLDAAQCELSIMLTFDHLGTRDYATALQLCQLAATQGYAHAWFKLGEYHGVPLRTNTKCMRAQTAGCT